MGSRTPSRSASRFAGGPFALAGASGAFAFAFALAGAGGAFASLSYSTRYFPRAAVVDFGPPAILPLSSAAAAAAPCLELCPSYSEPLPLPPPPESSLPLPGPSSSFTSWCHVT